MRVSVDGNERRSRRSLPVLLSAVLILALLVGCTATPTATEAPEVPVTAATNTAEPMETEMPTEAATEAPMAEAPDVVRLRFAENDEFGQFLVDEAGMSLYLFTRDEPGVSNCEGDCLAAWPPVLVAEGGTVEIDGADEGLLSTITRSDGSTQVAFNEWPLYYWVNDMQPGDTTGQGVGEVWYLLDPEGNGIGMPGSETSQGEDSGMDAPGEVRLMFAEHDEFGQYLTDEEGMALYLFTRDEPGMSNCEGDCLANWPPLLVTDGGTVEIEGADEGLLSTITRSDGSTQVAFNEWPLYYWVNDAEPGDTSGQGVGDVWYLLDPEGNGIGMPGASESSSSSIDEDYPDRTGGGSSGSAMDEVKLMVSESADLGSFLTDEKGMTLYLFTNDSPGMSACEGQCLVNWPPLLVEEGTEVEIDGMDEEGLIGTITRSDGTIQVTYKDMPLYYWVNDKQPGDTTGHEVDGVWFVVEP